MLLTVTQQHTAGALPESDGGENDGDDQEGVYEVLDGEGEREKEVVVEGKERE